MRQRTVKPDNFIIKKIKRLIIIILIFIALFIEPGAPIIILQIVLGGSIILYPNNKIILFLFDPKKYGINKRLFENKIAKNIVVFITFYFFWGPVLYNIGK